MRFCSLLYVSPPAALLLAKLNSENCHGLMPTPMNESEQIQLLQNIPIFGGMRADNLAFILERASRHAFSQGEFLCREGDPANEFFILEAGTVAILKQWDKQDYLLSRLGAGDCLGEMALIDYFPRSASAVAETECEALSLTARILEELYHKDLEQFALIQMNMARELSRRLRHASEQLFQSRTLARIGEDGVLYSSL